MTRTSLFSVSAAVLLCGCHNSPSNLENPDAAPPIAQVAPPVETADARAKILANSDLPESLPAPLRGDPAGVSTHQLSNGMTVYLSTNRQEPRITAWIAVRTGSRNDPAKSTGLAHYLEHMLFKGTDELGTTDFNKERPHLAKIAELYAQLRSATPEQRAEIFTQIDAETQKTAETAIPNEFDNLYSAMGISGLNAFTSDDTTCYIAEVPSNRFESWARTEAERFRDAQFRLFYPELEAVYEEKNRSLDNPAWRMEETMRAALFPNHPYGTQTTIGTIEHLKVPAYGDMEAYFKRWYAPNNTAIILSGDIEPAQALPILERYFGGWQPQALTPPEAASITPISGRVVREITTPGEESVVLAWQGAALKSADVVPLTLLDRLMSDNEAGLLYERLELPQKVLNAYSQNDPMAEGGVISIRADAKDGQDLLELEAAVWDVVLAARSGAFSDEALVAAKTNYEIEVKKRIESNGGRATAILNSYIGRQDWRDAQGELDALRALTREDVLRVANAYLTDNRVVLLRKHGEFEPPRIEKPAISPLKIDPSRHSKLFHEILDMPTTAIEPQWLEAGRDFQVVASKQPGKKIYTAQNRRNDLFTLSFAYEFGSRSDKLVCHALQVAEQSGAGSLDSVAFKRELYTLGTSIRTRCDDEEIIISLSGLDRNLERSLELYQTWISEPALVAEMAKAAGEIEISKRRANLDNPRYLSRALSAYANFGKNSSYLFEASNQAVGKASTAQLRKSVRNLGELAHHTFYFGPRNGAEIAPIVEPSGKLRAGKLPATLKFRKVQKPTIFYLDYPSAQSVIQVTFGHEPASAQERALLALLDEYVGGGMGGLMFQEIREARGLAYSATGSTFSGRREKDETALLTYVATQTDKTQEALRVTLELLRSPISPNRLAQAKRSFEERARTTRVDPRAVTSTVYSWNLQGKTADPGPEELAIIQSASIEQVQALLDTLTKEKAPIISVLGNRKNLDPKVLEQFGTVTEVKVDQLTSFGKF